jgi:hypothetical protein
MTETPKYTITANFDASTHAISSNIFLIDVVLSKDAVVFQAFSGYIPCVDNIVFRLNETFEDTPNGTNCAELLYLWGKYAVIAVRFDVYVSLHRVLDVFSELEYIRKLSVAMMDLEELRGNYDFYGKEL